MTNTSLRCTRGNLALVALKRVARYQRRWETSLTCPSRRQRSRTVAARTARLNTTNLTARKTGRIITSRHQARRRRKATRSWWPRRSRSSACFYDQSSTAKTTYRKSESSLSLASCEILWIESLECGVASVVVWWKFKALQSIQSETASKFKQIFSIPKAKPVKKHPRNLSLVSYCCKRRKLKRKKALTEKLLFMFVRLSIFCETVYSLTVTVIIVIFIDNCFLTCLSSIKSNSEGISSRS